MKSKKFYRVISIVIILMFCCNMFYLTPNYIDVYGVDETKKEIIGFNCGANPCEALYYEYKPDKATVKSEMPDSLSVTFADGTIGNVPVSWESSDYNSTSYFYYAFDATIDSSYTVSDSIKDSMPYCAVFLASNEEKAQENTGFYANYEALSYAAARSVTSSPNEEKVYQYLKYTLGLNDAACCGVLANIQAESGFNPNASGDSGTSYGICQWHSGRFTSLKNHCSTYGYDWTTLEGQLDYLKTELQGSYRARVYEPLLQVNNTANGAAESAKIWQKSFEVCAQYCCKKCGRDISYTNFYCSNCGITTENPRDRWAERVNLAKDTYWRVYGTTSPDITIAGEGASGTITYGDKFDVSGIVSSGLPLTSVKLNFYDGVGEVVWDWEMSPQGSTNFSIATSINNLPVGVHKLTVTASNAQKTNVILFEKTFAVLSHENTLPDGTYKISSSRNSTYLMGAAGGSSGDNVNLYVDNTQSGNPKNIWYIQGEGDGYYLIRNFKSGCYLDVASGSSTDGTNVSQWTLNRGVGQLWQILPAGGGTYCLVPKCATESCADVNSGDSSNIQIYGLHLGYNQRFAFTQTDGGLTKGNKISFNTNGGTLPAASVASHTVNGVNKAIGAGELIIYNTPGQTVTLPNTNYVMAKVGSNGLVSSHSKDIDIDSDIIPSGGFIILGHRSSGNDGASFLEQIRTFDYIGYNSSTKTAYAYRTENAYLANHKYVESGSVYGSLPTPIRTGYDFDGWYTSASGGTKITSSSTYSTNTLYAHWKTASGLVPINSVTFPDDNFRAHVEGMDLDKSGWLTEQEINSIWSMSIINEGIKDLTGIEYFTALQTLRCQQNELTSLDLSQNKNLVILNCSDNKLVSLDLSNNTKLGPVSCSNNNLVCVNLNNTQTTATSFTCNSDEDHSFSLGRVKNSYSLSNLEKYGFDVSKASNWKGATYNSSTKSLANFTSSEISYDYDCGNGITVTFYLTAYLDENIVQINSSTFPDANFRSYVLETIDTDKDGWLSKYEATSNSMSLANKGIKDLTGIEYFTVQWLYCQNNELTSIDISKNQTLALFNCSNNKLVSLDCSNNPNLATVILSNNNLVSLNVSNTRIGEYSILTAEQGNGFNIGKVTGSYSLSNLTKYGFVSSKASNWKGAVYNSASNSLTDFTSTQISYDYDCGKGLTATFYLVADSIPSSVKIDINSANFPDKVFRDYVLDNIDADKDSQLSQAEIESTTSIILGRAQDNGAKNLIGIEYFTELVELDCRFNALTSLDVSKNTKLQRLFCGSNKLSSLDVGKNTELTYLDCMENNLTSLNVRQNQKLVTLDCNDNKISSLDLTNNGELEVLYCYLNELTTLDVSRNAKLKSLKAHSNCLTNLDLSNTQITKTNLSNNRFEIGRESSYDLSNLMKYGFKPENASNWQGAVCKSNTIDCISGSDVTYDYDCGNGITATFILYRNPVSLKDSSTNIGVSSAIGFGYDTAFTASPNQFSVNLGSGLTAIKSYDTNLIKTGDDETFVGEASVSIPVPTGYEPSKLKVFRKEADGSVTDVKAVYNSVTKTLDFDTDSFGTFIVAFSGETTTGDLNNDGKIDLKDLAIMKYVLSQDDAGQYADSADLNGDGKVDLKDLAVLKYYIAEN
ncbi:MAG: phage tail tip lysozyme [Ruminococcus sp.]|nr:phage tail tip lysozyme [Ruminococcus sp.]MCM1381912.1 phage tail tip lysozyme [Muribaculaceae bacterium]MCM1480375.1 phage tail tip lysozyme [Muribaculaceae bacterium]